MQILIKWIFRSHRSGWLRTLSTVFGILCEFAAISSLSITIHSMIRSMGADGKGVILPIIFLLILIILLSPGPTLYVSTAFEERSNQFRSLICAGTTTRQIFKSIFVECASILLCGTIPGVACGYAIARLFVEKALRGITIETIVFHCSMRDLLRSTALEYLFVLSLMLIRALYILLSRDWLNPTYKRPSRNRHTKTIRRIFGIGGELGIVLSRNEKMRTTACMPSLVRSIMILFLMLNIFVTVATPVPVKREYNACLTLQSSDTMKSDASFEAATEEAQRVIRSMQDDGQIQNAVSCRTYSPHVFYMFSDDMMHSELTQKQNKRSVYSRFFRATCFRFDIPNASRNALIPELVFYDDAFFDALAGSSGLSLSDSQALFYNAGIESGYLVPILNAVPENGMRLYYYDVEDDQNTDSGFSDELFGVGNIQSGDSTEINGYNGYFTINFVRNLIPKSASDDLQDTFDALVPFGPNIQVGALLQDAPLGVKTATPTLILPERMRAQFGEKLSDVYSDSAFYFDLTDDDAAVRNRYTQHIWEELCDKADCDVHETIVGVGSIVHSDPENKNVKSHFFLTDVDRGNKGLRNYLNIINGSAQPSENGKTVRNISLKTSLLMYAILFGLPFIALFGNTLIIAHLNRSIRMREYATLTVLGIRRKQRFAMLMLESLLYGVRSVLYSIPFLLLLYPAIFMFLSFCVSLERTLTIANLSAFWGLTVPRESVAALIGSTVEMMHWLWICIPAAIVIFLVFFLSSLIVKVLMRHEDLIRILKETSYK